MEHYGTLLGATEYHTAMGNVSWLDPAKTDQERKAAMFRASAAMDGRFLRSYSGYKATTSQRLAWPRVDAWDFCADAPVGSADIPLGVVEASYELALLELQTPRSLSPAVNYGRLTKSESVEGAASRSFFGPAELGFGLDNLMDAFRPSVAAAEDRLGCYLNTSTHNRWVATVI